MSEVNASAIHGPYRRKVTLACDSCRKRRVRCSGNQPCASCCENEQQCVFDSSGRGRRGPRPRKSVSQVSRIPHKLAPRQPLMTNTNDKRPLELPKNPTNDVVTQASHAQEETEVADIAEADGSDSESLAETDTSLDSELWKPALKYLLRSGPQDLDVDLACHLVELFCARMNIQFGMLFSLAQVTQSIIHQTVCQGLLLAMCASSVRFSMHKATRHSSSEEFAFRLAMSARSHSHSSLLRGSELDKIRTLCILIEFETSRGCGRGAWVDISSAHGLVQLARLDGEKDSELEMALDSAERYLSITELSHCIHRPSFQPRHWISTQQNYAASFPDNTNRLLDLLGILNQINKQCLKDFRQKNPEPWGSESNFRTLQEKLEDHLIRDPTIFQMGRREAPSEEDGECLLAILTWHSCVILLNRTYLPIPERIKATGDGTEVKCIQFPKAPPLFLKERIHRCEASADAICHVIKEIISQNGFFRHTLLLGYCCMQSALVLINRLHRSSKPYNKQLIENLKRIFVVLGAVRTFYSPAKDWIDVLFRIHDTNSPLTHASGDPEAAFDSYFSRFLDIEEPDFMPLDPKAVGDESGATRTHEISPREGLDVNGRNSHSPPDKMGWLQTYVSHLSGDAPEHEDVGICDESAVSPTHIGDNHDAQVNDAATSIHLTGSTITGKEPTPCPQPMELVHSNHGVRSSFLDSMDGIYPDIFDQMPLVRDFFATGHEIPTFPGLGQLMDGEDIWADVFEIDLLPDGAGF